MAESEAVAEHAVEPQRPRRGRSPRAAAEVEAAEHAGDLQAVKFVASVRWLETERTSLNVDQVDVRRFQPRIVWHPRGVALEAAGQPTLVVPLTNLAWAQVR